MCHCGTGSGLTPLDKEQWGRGEVSREGTGPARPEPQRLSDYELQRLANMRRNADELVSLGLMGLTASDKTRKKRNRPKKKVCHLAWAFHRLCLGVPPPLQDLPLPWVIRMPLPRPPTACPRRESCNTWLLRLQQKRQKRGGVGPRLRRPRRRLLR